MTERGKESVFREIRARLFLQFLVGFLQLLLAPLEFRRERLRLLKEIFRPRVCFDRIQDNSNALGQLIEKSLVC